MCRSVIEATAKDCGVTVKGLKNKIQEMRTQELISAHTAEQAQEIRDLGNDMAHGDFADPISYEIANEIRGLMDEILEAVYESPNRLKTLKDARIAGKEKRDLDS